MRIIRPAVLLTLLATLGFAFGARCEPMASRVALVVGIDRYEHLRPLRNAVNDARDVADALRAGGFDVLFVSDATGDELEAAVADFAIRLERAELGLFYYAGHGFEVEGDNYLIPRDAGLRANGTLRPSQVLELLDLYREMAEPERPILLFLDACRNDPERAQASIEGRGAVSLSPRSGDTGFKEERGDELSDRLLDIGINPQISVVFSTSPGKTADDGASDHSPFADAIVKALRTPGMTLLSLAEIAADDTKATTNGRQQPYFLVSNLPNVSITPE